MKINLPDFTCVFSSIDSYDETPSEWEKFEELTQSRPSLAYVIQQLSKLAETMYHGDSIQIVWHLATFLLSFNKEYIVDIPDIDSKCFHNLDMENLSSNMQEFMDINTTHPKLRKSINTISDAPSRFAVISLLFVLNQNITNYVNRN
jgi:hypothetical protein